MRIPLAFLALSAFAAEMVPIPAGEARVNDAATGFTQTVQTGAFLFGRTEVTQREYARLMGVNPAHFRGAERPVENVSWFDAIRYANRLSSAEGLRPCYILPAGRRLPECNGYRLPTSAEWSWAYRAPGESPFRTGGYQDTDALGRRAAEGTRPIAQSPAGEFGLHDMAGNVWEWCEDWYSAAPALDAIRDPRGPATGVARVIRGGSYLTGGTQWNRQLLNSFPPTRRSRFTGFRLARTIEPAARPAKPDATWLARFQAMPAAVNPLPLDRTPQQIRAAWMPVLGSPNLPRKAPAATPAGKFTDPAWNAELLDLEVEPGFPTRILIVEPAHKPAGKLPVLIVPFYDVDAPAGANLGGRRIADGGTRAFARLAAQRGFLAVAVKWLGEADGEGYEESVENLRARHPGVTPLGKWIFDLQRVVDYLTTRPDVDAARIAMMGHSLGGKMTLYATAFEPRIRAAVSSEPGLQFSFSNYADFWYFGKHALARLPEGADQHELLALIAPRPFLLIAGESADGDKSWPALAGGRKYHPDPALVGMINHRSGHSPTEESLRLAFEWLERFVP